jgi:hypothetical protein
MLHPPFYGIPIDESGRPLVDPAAHQFGPYSPDVRGAATRFEVGSTPPPFEQSTTASFSPGLQSFASAISLPGGFAMGDSPTSQSPQDHYDIPIRSPDLSSMPNGQRDQTRLRMSSNGVPSAPDAIQLRLNALDAKDVPPGYLSMDGFVYTMQTLAATSSVTSNYDADRFAQPRGISRGFDGMPPSM